MLVHAVFEGEEIRDEFEIRVAKRASNHVPIMTEIGGRTIAIAQKWGRSNLQDLHRNLDGSACVCVKQEEAIKFPPGSDLPRFLDGLARDYLYGLAFYDRHGRWPWGERAHGAVGILEFYAENQAPLSRSDVDAIVPYFLMEKNWLEFDKQLRRPRGHSRCLCGSGLTFRECHPAAFHGVVKLAEGLDRLGIKRRTLFDRGRVPQSQGGGE